MAQIVGVILTSDRLRRLARGDSPRSKLPQHISLWIAFLPSAIFYQLAHILAGELDVPALGSERTQRHTSAYTDVFVHGSGYVPSSLRALLVRSQ